MAREKSVLNRLIDESIGKLVVTKGRDGFTYEDVEFRVRTELGSTLDSTMHQLGQAKLRDRIRDRARSIVQGQLTGTSTLHPRLFEDDAAAVYPVKGEDGGTVFKQIVHLNKYDFDEIIRDLISQRKGLDKHIKALRRIERRLKTIWNKNPEMDVETAQTFLDPKAA